MTYSGLVKPTLKTETENVPVFLVHTEPAPPDMNVNLYNRLMSLPIEERYATLDVYTKQGMMEYSMLHPLGKGFNDFLNKLRPDLLAIGRACLDTALQEEGHEVGTIGDLSNFRSVIVRRGNDITACLRREQAPAL